MIVRIYKIARHRNGGASGDGKFVSPIGLLRIAQGLNAKIDLRQLEPGRLDVKLERKLRQFIETFGECGVIPG